MNINIKMHLKSMLDFSEKNTQTHWANSDKSLRIAEY